MAICIKFVSLFLIKTTFTCLYISSICLHLVHKGSVAICNDVYIRSLQFIFCALRLLVVERVSTCQQAQHPLCTCCQTAGTRLLAPDYTGVGGSLT